jgi:GWxTD domain-containing protein
MILKTLTALLLFLTTYINAQVEMSNFSEHRGAHFHFNTATGVVPDNPELNRLSIYVEIRNDELQFIKTTEGYEASYEVSAVILDDDDDQVDGKIWKEEVSVENYNETNKREANSLSFETFDLSSGKYKVHLAVQDLETEVESKSNFKIEIKKFSQKKLGLSEITFLKNVEKDSLGIITIYPAVTTMQRGLEGNAQAYFEIYNPMLEKSAKIETEIFGRNTKNKIKNSYELALNGYRTLEAFPLNIDSLEHDSYSVKIEVKAGGDKSKTEKVFYVRWEGLPTNAQDLEAAINQVKYIATREEWKRLDKAVTDNKIDEFKAFWLRHDPTPGTEINEAMEAHYGRIEYANQYFSVMQREGWKTDMGMVFIILGSPDDIERNAYPRYSKPYEIWRYYRYNRELLFYDHTGFGEYRLSTPFSIYEFQRYLQRE